jgi:hypothetical protein
VPNTYQIDAGRRVVFITRTHRSAGEEFAAFVHRIVTDARFEVGMSVLDDRRLAEEAPETPELRLAISQLQRDRDRLSGIRWAAVLARDRPAVLGMYNMFRVLAEDLGIEMQIFFTMDGAKAWLGID